MIGKCLFGEQRPSSIIQSAIGKTDLNIVVYTFSAHNTFRLVWYVFLFPPINSILRQTFSYFASLERHIPDISTFFSFIFVGCCNVKAERWKHWAWAWTWDLDWMGICLLRHWNICRNQYFKHVLARDQRSYENWTYLILFFYLSLSLSFSRWMIALIRLHVWAQFIANES